MALNDINKNAIAFKKSVGKGHTQETFAFTEEKYGSNVQMSLSTVFGESINPLPQTDGGLSTTGATDNIVEKVRFTVEIIPDTLVGTNQSQGYRLRLPDGYDGVLSSIFSGGTYLYDGLGKLQIVSSLYGTLKPDGSTEYDPVLYQTDGETIIPKFDEISWILDPYSGILFVQSPPAGYDVSASRPGFVEAFLYVGKYGDEVVSEVSGERISKTFTQPSHGFALGDIVEYSGGTFIKALAVANRNTDVVGFVSFVESVNEFTVTFAGYVDNISSLGLNPSTIYYLSSTGAGELVDVEPVLPLTITRPMLMTFTADEAIIFQYRGLENVSGSTGTGTTTLENVGTGTGQIFAGTSGDKSFIRTLTAGSGMTITTIGDNVILSTSGGGTSKSVEMTTASGVTILASAVNNEYVSSGTTLYTLPATPTIGAQLTFSDGIGSALLSNIIIDGNGKLIYGDTYAAINTNYGSITISYNGISWNVVAFAP